MTRAKASAIAIGGEVVRLQARRPAGMQRWQQGLHRVQALERFGHAGGKIIVEQDGAGVEALQHQAIAVAFHRLQLEHRAIRQIDGERLGQVRDEAADAHRQAGLAQDVGQRRHVLQIEEVARVVLGYEQKTLRRRAHLFHRHARRLHRQGQEGRVEVVEAAGKQVGVHRRQLEAGVAQVDRGIERRGVFLPLQAEPVLDGGLRVEGLAFDVAQRTAERRSEVGNHVGAAGRMQTDIVIHGPRPARLAHVRACAVPARDPAQHWQHHPPRRQHGLPPASRQAAWLRAQRQAPQARRPGLPRIRRAGGA